MSPAHPVLARGSSDPLGGALPNPPDSVRSDNIQLAGLIVALVIASGGILWLSIYFYRKRRAAKRERAFGVGIPNYTPLKPTSETEYRREVSRAQLTASVVLPASVMASKDATRVQIVEHHTGDAAYLHPPAPRGPTADSSRRSSILRPASGSFLSTPSSSYRTSAYSTASSMSAFDESHQRKVRQPFRPTLPDELVIAVGEQLAVVRSFDDGWCIVGRESRNRVGDIEMGAVPGWVFQGPLEGIKVERPIRTSSLGVTVTLDSPGGPCFSWTNAS